LLKIAAVICEYNPFHNGHKHQIELIKKDFDAVVCIMSGSFSQRGEVAIFDKWSRAKSAVLSGVDLVLELPVRYVLSSAKEFAMGGVELANSLGICDNIVFGSECGDISILSKTAEALLNETPDISNKIKSLLDSGLGYPAACQAAYDGVIDKDILNNPNNILAVEYIMALKRTNSSITPVTHSRTVGYFDTEENGKFASATLIREKIKKGENIDKLVPIDYSSLETYDTNKLTDILKYKLINGYDFSGILGYEAGLENRLMKAIDKDSFDEMIDSCVTKRYTKARLKRMALRYILDIKGGYISPSYLRILASNDTGRNILSQMKSTASLPIITKVADFSNDAISEEIRATDISSLCASKPTKKGRDFYISPIML